MQTVVVRPNRFAFPFTPCLARTFLCMVLLAGAPIGAKESVLRFTHKERSLQPGEVVLYDIQSARPLQQLKITAFGRAFPAFPVGEPSRWNCLVGIDLNAAPGRYDMEFSAIASGGEKISATDTLLIVHKDFPTRRLTVEPEYVTPPPKVQSRIRKERDLVDSIFGKTSPLKLWEGPFRAPVPGKVISAFGKRSVYNGEPRSPHSGTDFRAALGTPIHAPNSGRIVFTGNLYYTGNTVILDHGLGMYSYLGHMSSIKVKEGENVKTGDIVGKAGATGRVTGPHLHWTVRLRLSRVDPLSLINISKKSGQSVQ